MEDPVTVTAVESRAIATVTIVAEVGRQQTVPATEPIDNPVPDEATTATQTPTAVGTRRPSATPNRTATPTSLPTETVATIEPTATPWTKYASDATLLERDVTGHILYSDFIDDPDEVQQIFFMESVQHLLATDTSYPTRLALGGDARYSPQGQRIAFVSDHAGTWDVYMMSLGSSDITPISNNAGIAVHPAWSPSGKKIAYAADTEQNGLQIFVYDVELAQNSHLTTIDGVAGFPDWSPDGSSIVFTGIPSDEVAPNIYLLDIASNSVSRLTDLTLGEAFAPRWSPDGQTIAYLSDYAIEVDLIDGYEVEGYEVHVMRPATGESRRLTRVEEIQGIFAPLVWSPDGKYLLAESLRDNAGYIIDVETGRIEILFDTYLNISDWFILDN